MFLTLDEELEVVGEAHNGAEALDMARRHKPDVVLMDLLMPVMDGVAATEAIRREMPEIEVIALTSVLEDSAITEALSAGATGYLLKNTEADKLGQAIKAAAQGQVQLSPQVAQRLLTEIKAPEQPDDLTPRETEVLKVLTHGNSNQEIAEKLYITEKTVKTHVSNILSKLNVSSRLQAALYALRTGLVTLDELRDKAH
jgi:DNA-binding NarL/FixJ family response regulator